MMRQQMRAAVVGLAALAFPMMGLADVSGTPTLAAGTMLNLDTGATGATGGDFLWTGNAITPQPGVGAFGLGALGSGSDVYDSLTQTILSSLPYSTASITTVSANGVLAFKTKSGNYAKVLVVTVATGGSLSLKFTTYGASGTGGGGGPTISAIQNNYGQVPQGLPNYGIAPGSLFFVQGSGLANSTTDLLSSAPPGLQTTVAGVSVSVDMGGSKFQCPLYYLSPTQIDAVLPGGTPTGTGTLTVTNGSATVSSPIVVVQSAFGILFYNGSLAAAYDANNNLITTSNAANPGQTIVLWGSGVGADPKDDDKNFPQQQDNLTNIPMQAYFGSSQATIAYRGRSQYPGVDQVVLTIPVDAPTGCFVSLSIVSGNIVSNSVTIPIAASGRTCSDSNTGLSSDLIQILNGKTSLREGFLGVSQTTSIRNGASQLSNGVFGTFFQANNLSSGASGGGAVSLNSCLIISTVTSGGTNITTTPLDAGPTITVNGPAGSLSLGTTIAGQSFPGTYFPASGTVPDSFIPSSGGAFTFDNGSGGKDVQHFNATLNVPPAFTWTNQAQVAAVNRAQGVNVTWSGGSPGTFVTISGSSSTTAGGKTISASFTCEAPISAGQFTVPSYVTLPLPAGNGQLTVGDYFNFQLFTAPGLDLGLLSGSSATTKSLAYN